MFRAVLVCLTFSPTAAFAQDDIRSLVVDYAQASGCDASLDMLQMLVEGGMARPLSELDAAIDDMIAEGELERSTDGTSVRVLPPLCEVVGEGTSLAMAAGFIGGVIAGAEDCRLRVQLLREQTVEQGLPPEAFEPALDRLEAEGAVMIEGDEVAHTGC